MLGLSRYSNVLSRNDSVIVNRLSTLVLLTVTYRQVKTNPNITHASALLLTSTFWCSPEIFQSHRWKTYLIMSMFATSLLLF